MGEVTISVAGRAYQVVCEDGEENRLTAIAARVDQEAQAFGGATPSLSESRLLLMCALLLADKLDEVEAAPQTVPAHLPASANDAEIDLTSVDEATARIKALAQSEGSEAAPEDVQASSDDEGEPAQEAPQEPGYQAARPSKSSAAVAAERDLLSWADRSETKDEASDEQDGAEATSGEDFAGDDAQEAIALDPALAAADPLEDQTQDETEDEQDARERSERRKRRRERLARLAKDSDVDL